MTASRATLRLETCGRGTRVLRAAAEAPQRWSVSAAQSDGWLEVTHQVLGVGIHGDDALRTRISAGPGARAVVRAAASTSLRGARPSRWSTRIDVSRGATLLSLPGALIPHCESAHSQSTRLEVAEGGAALLVGITLPGRLGMGEDGTFSSLRLRTVARFAGTVVFAEDVVVEPLQLPLRTSGMFGTAGAVVSLLTIGDWEPADPAWWRPLCAPGARLGVSRLRSGGLAGRALCSNLGEAMDLVAAVNVAARHACR